MTRDPLLDEVRAIREDIARENGHDLVAIFQALKDAAARRGCEHVSPTPPAVTNVATAAAHCGSSQSDGKKPSENT